MRTLIVLCAGDRVINNLPVFLNRHPDGKILAEKAIEGVFIENYDEVIFTVLKSVNEKYHAEKIIEDEITIHNNIKVFKLDKPTSGPAESVYLTIKGAKIEGEFAVRDSLNGITISKDTTGNFVSGLDLTKYEDDVFNVRSKSFIVTNEQGQVLDVIEKRFRSDIISVGLYGFKKTSDFIMAYEKLNDINYPINKMYLSNVISYLIGYKQRVFHCVDVSFHEDWGTPETWSRLEKKYATIFVDVDKLIGANYTDEMASTLIESLSVLKNKLSSIVLFTRTSVVNKKQVYNLLEEKNIHCIDFVCGVSHSTEQIMISDEKELQMAALGL